MNERGDRVVTPAALRAGLEPWPVRLPPGADLRDALQRVLADRGCEAAFVIAGIGSLAPASLRPADAREPVAAESPVELLTLSGTLSPSGPHLHASVADVNGHVCGGHVGRGCIVRTTVEVLLVLLPAWSFAREFDAATGYDELVVRSRQR